MDDRVIPSRRERRVLGHARFHADIGVSRHSYAVGAAAECQLSGHVAAFASSHVVAEVPPQQSGDLTAREAARQRKRPGNPTF